MDAGDGARQPDGDGGLGREPWQGEQPARARPRPADPDRRQRRPDAVDERRRRGLVEGAVGVERDDRPGDQSGRGARPALRGGGLAGPDLRHRQAKLSRDRRSADRHRRGDRRDRRYRAQPAAVRDQGIRRRDEPGQFRVAQSRGDEAHQRDQGREPPHRAQEHARRHFARADPAEPRRRVRAWPQPRHHPGQGHPRNAAVPVDPLYPDHRRGIENAPRRVPAVDQPLLHPRPHAGKKLRQMDRRPGGQPVHGQLEIGRRKHRRRHQRRLCRRAGRSDRAHPRPARCRGGPHHRLLRRGHHAGDDAGVVGGDGVGNKSRFRDFFHRAGRLYRGRRPQAVPRRRDHGDARQDDRRDRGARRAGDGGDLQPAARARPDLELCRQQLPHGQRPAAVRPAPLER